MRTRIVSLFAVITVMVFTGCKQDREVMNEIVPAVQEADPEKPAEAALPVSGTARVDMANPEGQPVSATPELLLSGMTQGRSVSLRSDAYHLELSSSPRNPVATCGNVYLGTTAVGANNISYEVYEHFNMQADLDGGDQVYVVQVEDESILNIDISGTQYNQALLLFGGNHNYYNGRLNLYLSNLIAYSTSASPSDDRLAPLHLRAGFYYLVIDSRAGNSSPYQLRVRCAPVAEEGCKPGSWALLSDNFSRYQPGNISPQSFYWAKWNPEAAYDGEVRFANNLRYLKMEYKPSAPQADQPNVNWRFGERHAGSYQLCINMYLYRERSAQFSIQKRLTPGNTANEAGAKVFLHSDGSGTVRVGNQVYVFRYTPEKWIQISIDFDLDANTTVMSIDFRRVASWPCTWFPAGFNGSRRIEAVNFFPYASDSQFFIRDIRFAEL